MRRAVVAGALLVGTGLLGTGLSARPGSPRFYAATLAAAGVWGAGAMLSGPVPLGGASGRNGRHQPPVVLPVLTGVAAFGLFRAVAPLARRVPPLEEAITRALVLADDGDERLVLLTALANAVGEEMFFRGALYGALGPRHPVAGTTAVYTLATCSTRNPALVLGAVVMGVLHARQRRVTGGVLAPVLTHLTWSALMLRHLPRVVGGRR